MRDFRLEFVHESAAEVREVVSAHRAFLAAWSAGDRAEERTDDLKRRLSGVGAGTTEGSLMVPSAFGQGLPAPDAFAGLEALPVL